MTMKKEKKYCTFCGYSTIVKMIDGKNRVFCPNCKTVFYENPLPVASSIVVNDNREVLLVKRKNDPYKDMWCLPIGFAESGEEVAHAALRELQEESGIEGTIIRLIDVDTVENDFYGSLAIITYEVKRTGGMPRPGDDASDVRYFPIHDIPALAWTSNEKALNKFLDQYKDTWEMMDSFNKLVSQLFSSDSMPDFSFKTYLTTILVDILEKESNVLNDNWIKEVNISLSSLSPNISILSSINHSILKCIKECLVYNRGISAEKFYAVGNSIKKLSIPLHDFFNALALSRKSIWLRILQKNIRYSPVEIFSILELNNRIVFLYDRIASAIIKGYNISPINES